jgi:tetratricopeptide (TPR) repeat protein
MRRRLSISAFVLVILIFAGCGDKNTTGSITGVSPDDARQLNGERSAFETSEDPPIRAKTYYAAGLVAESHNDFAKAAAQYNQALKLAPENRAALYRLGVCQSHLKKYPEAIATWKKYLEATQNDPSAYSNLGFCHELAGELDQAEQAYREGIDKDPKSVPCRTNYGLMLARIGRTSEATLQLQAVLSEAEVHYNLGSVLEMQGRHEGAKQEYRKALELDPELADAQLRLSALE